MPAYRNLRICTKDCLCLYVCPTGATDTENGIIDVDRCLVGCHACADSCVSGAISIVPRSYPPPQEKTEPVGHAQRDLGVSKARQEFLARGVAKNAQSPVKRQFAQALALSNRRMAEDVLRESGYLLPQSDEVRLLLESLLTNTDADFPRTAVELLLARLEKPVG